VPAEFLRRVTSCGRDGLDTFVRFTAEYAPGGALHPPAKDASAVTKAQWTQTAKVAKTCPNNDDPCEQTAYHASPLWSEGNAALL
jgi:hypothetical protein